MREKLAFCLLLICLQGGTEDRLKVGGGGGGGGGSVGLSVRHGSCYEGEKRLVTRWEREGAQRPRVLIPQMLTDMGQRAPRGSPVPL